MVPVPLIFTKIETKRSFFSKKLEEKDQDGSQKYRSKKNRAFVWGVNKRLGTTFRKVGAFSIWSLEKRFQQKNDDVITKIKEGPFSGMLKECIVFHLWSPHVMSIWHKSYTLDNIDTLGDVTFKEETEISVRKVLKTASKHLWGRD